MQALLKATVEANQEIMTGKQEILDKNKEDLDGVAAAMQLTSSKLVECGAAAAYGFLWFWTAKYFAT